MRAVVGLIALVTCAMTAGIALVGCSDVMTASGAGELDIVIATSGKAPDPDGYTLVVRRVEGAITVTEQAVAVTTAIVLGDVEPGLVVAELRGVAASCSVEGEHPRVQEVRGMVATRVAFAVTCAGGA